MSHQITKIVKVGSLSEADRKARGLADMPDDMEVPIVVEEIVTDPVAVDPKPIELKRGQRRQKLAGDQGTSMKQGKGDGKAE